MKSLIKNPITQWLNCYLKKIYLKRKYSHKKLSIGNMVHIGNCTFGNFDAIHDEVKLSNCAFGSYNTIFEGAQLEDSKLGDYSYVAPSSILSRVSVGKFSCIGPEVIIGLATHPSRNFVSTHPIFYSPNCPVQTTFASGSHYLERCSISIGNDVWIGARALILDGVKIGDGAIIGAGAVVTKDIPDYAVAVGVPARVVRYRFDASRIDYLKQFKWWDRDINWLRQNSWKFLSIQEFIEKTDEAINR